MRDGACLWWDGATVQCHGSTVWPYRLARCPHHRKSGPGEDGTNRCAPPVRICTRHACPRCRATNADVGNLDHFRHWFQACQLVSNAWLNRPQHLVGSTSCARDGRPDTQWKMAQTHRCTDEGTSMPRGADRSRGGGGERPQAPGTREATQRRQAGRRVLSASSVSPVQASLLSSSRQTNTRSLHYNKPRGHHPQSPCGA
jgi:hypothetical protein